MVKITNTTLFFVLCLVTSITGHTLDVKNNPLTEDLELEKQIILKPHIMSIHTNSGHIVDCVDINKQPALDHPLLKNHKLQRKPCFERKINQTSVKSSPNLKHWLEHVRCPKGTVPIQRLTKNDLIQGKYVFNVHNKGIVHQAHVLHEVVRDNIHGIKGTTSIYNPKVNNNQSSTGHLFVLNKVVGAAIIVGWHVSPGLYRDDHSTYFYSLWTSDSFKSTGCYNMFCKGFVQTHRSYYIGSRIRRTSTYGGEMIEMQISLNKDRTSHNWWLTVADKTIGYFPAAIFSDMVKDSGGWGGVTRTPEGTSSPPMGSGHFPDKNFVHASYFRDVGIQVDDSEKYYQPNIVEDNDNFKCYGINYYGDQGEEFGYTLQFGGPVCNN